MRADVFANDTLQQQVGMHPRSVGRPRQVWATEVWNAGVSKLGGTALAALIKDERQWIAALNRAFK